MIHKLITDWTTWDSHQHALEWIALSHTHTHTRTHFCLSIHQVLVCHDE